MAILTLFLPIACYKVRIARYKHAILRRKSLYIKYIYIFLIQR